MKLTRGFPKPKHYFMMKRRRMLPSQPTTIHKRQSFLGPKTENEQGIKISWWGWLLLLFVVGGLLRLCEHM